jgi:hypothetical protein
MNLLEDLYLEYKCKDCGFGRSSILSNGGFMNRCPDCYMGAGHVGSLRSCMTELPMGCIFIVDEY